MIPLFELSYLAAPPIALGALILCGVRPRWRRVSLLAALLSVGAWSCSVWVLSAHWKALEWVSLSSFDGKVDTLIAKLGAPSVRVVCDEGDTYLIYSIRVWPWREISIFNTVDNTILYWTRANDLQAFVDSVCDRSQVERELVSRNVRFLREQGGNSTP